MIIYLGNIMTVLRITKFYFFHKTSLRLIKSIIYILIIRFNCTPKSMLLFFGQWLFYTKLSIIRRLIIQTLNGQIYTLIRIILPTLI